MQPPDESPPLSSSALLAEISDKLDRTLSAAAQASLQAARTTRLLDANHQLDARQRMAQIDAIESLRRIVRDFEHAVAPLVAARRPPSLTVVADVPITTAASRQDDDTGVFVLWRGTRRKIPTKMLVPLLIVCGGLLHWCAAHLPEIVDLLRHM